MRALVIGLGLAGLAGGVGIRHLPQHVEAEPTRASHPQEIQSISLDGRALPSLREVLSAHAGDRFDSAKAAQDRGALETALVDRGYLSAKVSAAQVTRDGSGGVFVTYAITQGPLFHVRNVTVTGTTEKAAGVVTLGVGDVVEADRIAHARSALAERLAVRGKPVIVVANVRLDETAALADVELAATP